MAGDEWGNYAQPPCELEENALCTEFFKGN